MRKHVFILVVLISITSVVGATENNEHAKTLLEAARTAWEESGLTDYSYTLERGGVFGAGPKLRVRVEAGECVKVTYWRRFLRHEGSCDNRTILGLLDELDREIQQNPISTRLRFDPQFGYPLEVSVEPRTDLSDQDWWYVITRFRR
jgi:hypothetical protein